MIVLLDEAGDTGFKFDAGSSQYFVVGLLVFEDNDEALACDHRISLLRRELDLKDTYEFHYKKDSNRIKSAFLQAISPYEFFYYGIVIDKSLLRSDNMRIKESFYKYACSLVFENAKDKLEHAILIIDKQGGKKFEKELQTYIKRRMNQGDKKIKKVKTQHSHTNNLIQLVDYIASGIYRKIYRPEKNNFMEYIAHREMYVQIRPKQKSTPTQEGSTS